MYYIFQILSNRVGKGNLIATPLRMKSERLKRHKQWLTTSEADVVQALVLLWTTSAIYVFEGECDF